MDDDFFSHTGSAREDWILRHDAPAWCHPSVSVVLGGAPSITIKVAPDYWGYSKGEFMRTPMKPKTAQAIADRYNYMLPTTKIVTALLDAGGHRLHAYTQSTRNDEAYHKINAGNERDCLPYLREELVCGHRKDIVISNYITQGKIAIFGWHGAAGTKPIQPLSTVHSDDYVDYSHGVRMISRACSVDGADMDLVEVLKNRALCGALSSEGPLRVLAYR